MTTTNLLSLLNPSIQALFSLHFLFLAGMILLLLQKKSSDKAYNVLLFFSIFSYFLFFYRDYLHIFQMAGDNICQIAYWKIIFHDNLTGSIGASYTKPGQLLILGALYEVSGICGETAFSGGICLVMAGCVWCLSRIATNIGGRLAGFAAFLASSYVFLPEFFAGSYSIFLTPVLFTGIWLYFYSPDSKTLGRVLLVLSIQFHIQAITVVAVIWCILLIKREWRELALFSAASSASLAVWLVVILRIQGAFERLNSGAAAGYVAPFGEAFAYDNKLDYIYKAVTTELAGNYTICALLALAVIGIVGSHRNSCKAYLSVFSIIILLMINVVLLDGTINLGRYFSLLYAFGCSVGIATMVQFAGKRLERYKYLLLLPVIIPFVLLMNGSIRHYGHLQLPDYITSAATLLQDKNIPFSTRLMTEDDLLYPIVMQHPDRYQTLTALQYFNVSGESKRKQILAKTDYIWIVTTNGHPYYYLRHTVLPAWQVDTFRQMVYEIIQHQQPKKLYGFCFTPLEISTEHLLIQVKPDTML